MDNFAVMKKKAKQRTSFLGGSFPKLTKAEQEVMYLLTKEFLTPKQISIRRQTTDRATQLIIQSLREKGAINLSFQDTSQKSIHSNISAKNLQKIRLHGQEFHVKLLYKDYKYKELLKKSNIKYIDGNTIRLYRDSIEVYGVKDFYADDVQKATAQSFRYWNRFFAKLEHELKVILIKPRAENIKLVNSHYAETNNELAQDCEVKGDKIRVYATDDGKLWFLIDNSFNLHEAEALHPQTSKPDMENVKAFFNDLRNYKVPKLSEIMIVFKQFVDFQKSMTEINKETAAGLNAVVSYIQSQLPQQKQEEIIPKEKPDYFG